jgi:transposase
VLAAGELARAPKKGAQENAHIVLSDECGFLLSPLVKRTLAPSGQTPVLPHSNPHQKIAAIAGLSLSPKAGRLGLYFQTFPNQSINSQKAADFLRELLKHLRGRVILIWDRLPMHRGQPIQELLAAYPRLTIELLPAYAPDLNPVEWLWTHIKYHELANFTPENVTHLDDTVTDLFDDAKHDSIRLRSFYQSSRIPLPDRTLTV